MRPEDERWDLLIATCEILYYHKPMPHEFVYDDQYICIRRSRDVTPRGFDVVLKDPHETTVMCIKVTEAALSRSFKTKGCKVYVCRQGRWCDYVLQLAAKFKEEFYQAEQRRQAELEPYKARLAEQVRQKEAERERQLEANFARVDDAELFAEVLPRKHRHY